MWDCAPTLLGKSNTINSSKRASLNQTKAKWWVNNFGTGNISFVVPRDHRGSKLLPPNRHYHSLEGVEILFVRWEIAFQGLRLACANPANAAKCDDQMIRSTTQEMFRANHHIVDASGGRIFAFTVTCKCSDCKFSCLGTDGAMLHRLPSYTSILYPVDAQCASFSKVQLNRSLTQMYEVLGITHIPADPMAAWIREALYKKYVAATASYFTKVIENEGVPDYPSFEEWSHGMSLPPAKVILDTFRKGFESTFTLSGVSDMDRCNREIQAVGCESTFCNTPIVLVQTVQ
jgi:hypothetical protein